jgi:hypothetical protein
VAGIGTSARLPRVALADLKARCLPSADAFALNYPDEVPAEERCGRHQTLFDRDFLERFGFQPVRSQGQVSLMRLDLGGLEPGRAPGLAARIAARVRAAAPAARPEPV